MKGGPKIPDEHWPQVEAALEHAFEKALGRRPEKVHVIVGKSIPDAPRICRLCDTPLTTEILVEQAEKLLEPFAGMKLERTGAVRDEVAEILKRAAGPYNAGLDCCYSCAYGLHQSVTLELAQ